MSQTKDDHAPTWDRIGQHALMPRVGHDGRARFNFLTNLNRHLARHIAPGNREIYERRVKPRLEKDLGRQPKDRHEVCRAMNKDPYHQMWSALRRNTMEMRQQAGREVVLGQIEELAAKASELNGDGDSLILDTQASVPNYVSAADNHCMPGSYYTELIEGDVSAAANYDVGIFVTTGGALGRYSDGGGEAITNWMRQRHPHFQPRRILEIGCGLGHSLLPIAMAFPEAEVVGVDVAAPMLRYGHARARDMGIHNITFIQAAGEDFDAGDESYDWIQTTMFLHETSNRAIHRIMANVQRMLARGGLTLHLEQPAYDEHMDLFEQCMRDWDCYNNNEPFWSKMHEIDVYSLLSDAGFASESFFEASIAAVVDEEIFPRAPVGEQEDHGRAAVWHAFGAWKR